MNPGELRHKVQIQTRSTVQDSAGEPQLVWNLFATRRAALERTPGKEVFTSNERQGRVPTTFRLRYLAGVLPAMRLLHGTHVYDILSAIDPDGMGAELVVTCELHVEETP